MRKTIFDDGFQDYLVAGATFVGSPGIPMLMDLHNTQIPREMIPFSKAKSNQNHRAYVHFYMHDREFSRVLTSTTKYLDIMKLYDGVITPDCSMTINQAPCLQQANTYMNRAVGFFFQKNGIPVIPNIRWSDESSYDYCFLGVPAGQIVCISTHGCLKTPTLREAFKQGLGVMLDRLQPSAVLVHGYMPDYIFGEYSNYINFHRYPSEFEQTHRKSGVSDGIRF